VSLSGFVFAVFCVLPPVLLGVKVYSKGRISPWPLFVSFVLVGWVLWNLTISLHFEELARLASTTGASDEIMDAAQNDGAARVFALYFGWAIAAFYFGACALVFFVCGSIYRRLQPRTVS
jgi:hypothetical protein